MDNIHIIITDQPLCVTGYGTITLSREVAFLGIVFLCIISSYVGYKTMRWILGAFLPCA